MWVYCIYIRVLDTLLENHGRPIPTSSPEHIVQAVLRDDLIIKAGFTELSSYNI